MPAAPVASPRAPGAALRVAAVCASLLALAACAAPPELRGSVAVPGDPGPRAAPFRGDAELAREAGRAYRDYLDALRRSGAPAAAPATVERVRRIVGRLEAAAGAVRPAARDWHWQLTVPAGGDDAWCLPGGATVVDAGLADRFAGDDDALAALVAHGFAHALLGHARERAPMLADAAHPFGAVDESEADRLGVELAARAGFDPRAEARAILSLQAPDAAAGDAARTAGWLRIHPMYDGRLADLARYAARVEPFYRQASGR